ncbi:hypothetical protein K227x_37960 [Rubripirellula lacrimiformis]|uniref:Sialate O-acetylesterase domain-containing protein n=1 Tax=Rubripirellula lacrimiformis TaxID=1930273 RepID=A0A517NE36_9BACT|nr:sialate O-acetylesterase [Rubripirellula lacrimiformis]QDT05396.1 hypothetical protein K227x_37960 [Rubripirellula lacrimiformis]
MPRFLLLVAFATVFSPAAQAELSVPNFFSDHMVLQRDRPAEIWGKATAGSEVNVQFKGNRSTVVAGPDGRWRVGVETGKADAAGADLTIQSGSHRITIHDVLVGEVWFASGQSNMVFTMNRVPAYADVIAKSDYPQIRMFNAPTVTAVTPQEDIDGQWTLCSPKSMPGYSAVAFFFARKLHEELGIPVGVIKSAWGGKPVETFTSRAALDSLPGTKALVDAMDKADANYNEAKAQVAYRSRLDQWEADAREQRKLPADQRKKLARKPTKPKRPLDTEGKPGVLFNSMINPFAGYTIRGAIWYQGEGNAKPGAVPYDQTLPLMIRDWRTRWNDDFSFYFVQLANYRQPSTMPGTPDHWALLQDRMRLVLDTTPKTGMAIINDVGDAKDIHPKNKHDPGERLALWALAKDYGQELVYSGPLFQSSSLQGASVRVTFDQAGDGLKSRDGETLKRFEIAGKDRIWHWADAKIDGPSSVVVTSDAVPNPVAVRYAWAANPKGANLVNSAGLPASVFRTDDWDDFGSESEAKSKRLQRQQ